MTAPVSESPNAESEGTMVPASTFEGGQCMCRGSQSGIQHVPATRFAAARLAAGSEAASPMSGGETPVMCGIFTAIVESAFPHALSLIPASPQMVPGETPAYITVAQMLRNTVRAPIHAATCRIGIARTCYRSAELAAGWPPSSNHASRTVS